MGGGSKLNSVRIFRHIDRSRCVPGAGLGLHRLDGTLIRIGSAACHRQLTVGRGKTECPSGATNAVFKSKACHDCGRRFNSCLRFAAIAAAAAGMLRIGAWRRGGDDASLHGGGRGGTWGTRPCDLAVPVPVYGAGRQTARPAQAGSGHDPCCRGRGRQCPGIPSSPAASRSAVG